MVAQPCVVPYTGNSHIGSRDRCGELGYAARIFQPTDWNSSFARCDCGAGECEENKEELHMLDAENLKMRAMDLSDEEAEYLHTIMQSSAMAWLAEHGIDPVARTTTAMTLSENSTVVPRGGSSVEGRK